jgi:hypothetical protein
MNVREELGYRLEPCLEKFFRNAGQLPSWVASPGQMIARFGHAVAILGSKEKVQQKP